LVAIEDAESGVVSYVSTKSKAMRAWFATTVQAETEARAHFFRALNLTELTVSTSRSAIDALVVFFRRRAHLR
jgi:hypothetical protein